MLRTCPKTQSGSFQWRWICIKGRIWRFSQNGYKWMVNRTSEHPIETDDAAVLPLKWEATGLGLLSRNRLQRKLNRLKTGLLRSWNFRCDFFKMWLQLRLIWPETSEKTWEDLRRLEKMDQLINWAEFSIVFHLHRSCGTAQLSARGSWNFPRSLRLWMKHAKQPSISNAWPRSAWIFKLQMPC